MAYLSHMTMMTDDVFDMITKGLWVSMEGLTSGIWPMTPETHTNSFST